MGLVYACKHRELTGHMVAIKVLFPEVASDAVAAARFKNEIFASYDVSHPNVVRAYEYLRDGDLIAYTMEFVGGGDLATRLERGEAIPIDEAVDILCQMCAGVQAIHDAGIVHRDLKPENILLTRDGVVKIADFGIARTGYGPKLTEHGGVVGTIDYVSPEYMLNSQVDWRSDIYAMGILAYEMVTGESPFRGESVYATMTKRLKSDPQPPSSLNPACPPELDAVILRAMARKVDERYQSAADMFADLQPLLAANSSMPSGAYLQVNRKRSGEYVGPKLDGGIARDPGPQAPRAGAGYDPVVSDPIPSQADVAATVLLQPDFSGGYQSSEAASAGTTTWTRPGSSSEASVFAGAGQSGSSSAGYSYGDPEVVSIASQYQQGDSYSRRSEMPETIVTYNELVSRGIEPRTNSGSQPMIRERSSGSTERLADLAARVERSVWVEIATLAVAILIGVGLGFFLVRTFFPDLLGLDAAHLMMDFRISTVLVALCLA